MEYRARAELNSCKGEAYDGSLRRVTLKVPKEDWEDLKGYAECVGTTAGEVVRCLIRGLLAAQCDAEGMLEEDYDAEDA